MVRTTVKERTFVIFTWAITAILVSLAIFRWYEVRLSGGQQLGSYDLFPLLGLVAFTLMWSHYVGGALRRYLGIAKEAFDTYFKVTAWVVLVLILLHPGLLWYNLWADGFGLPPGSYLSIYTESVPRVALLLGSLSLFAFLLFELRHRYKNARWWRFVEYANVAAMFAIFYHALTLGGEVASGWFRVLWFCYGAWLIIAVGYTYYSKRRRIQDE